MNKRFTVTFLSLLIVVLMNAGGTAPLCQIKNYAVNDGLMGTTMNILQDSKGFLWVSTWNGLNKFDGYTFKNYKAFSGDSCVLTNNRITDIFLGNYDKIWCRTYDSRVYLFDIHQEEFIDVLLPIEQKIKYTNTVQKLYHLEKGVVWMICDKGYSFRIDEHLYKKGEGIMFYNSSNHDFKGGKISRIYQDSDGDEWILTDKGISIIGNKKVESDFPFNQIKGTDQYIFLASTSGKLACYDRNSGRLEFIDIPYRLSRINTLNLIDQDQLIFSTDNGLIIYDISTRKFHQIDVRTPGASSNNVTSVYKDRHGEFWVYTDAPGITHIQPGTGEKQHFMGTQFTEVQYDRDITNVIFEDKIGTLWMVPNKANLCYYDREKKQLKTYYNTFNHAKSPFLPFIFTHYIDKQDNFWFTTKHGIIKMSFFSPTYKLTRIGNGLETRAFFLDRQKRLWVAEKSGLLRLYDAEGSLLGYFTPQGTISRTPVPFIGMVYCFMEDKDGTLWLGTKTDGLIRLKEKNENNFSINQFIHQPHDKYSLSDNSIYSIFQDRSGRIWIGSYGGGLNLLNQTEDDRIEFIHSNNKLETYPVQAQKVRFVTQSKEGIMMVGTTEGLLTFSDTFGHPEEIKFYNNIRNHKLASSLGSNDVMHIFIDSHDDIYISTFTGGINKVISKNLLSENIEFKNYNVKKGLVSDLAFSMIEDAEQNLWIVLENSLSKFDREQETFDNYNFPFLQQEFQFSEAIPNFNSRGEMVFGSNKGFIEIASEQLKKSDYIPAIAFTGLKIHGLTVDTKIDDLDVLALKPSQRDVTFQFAAFDYTEPRDIHYAYRLEGLEKNWNYADNSRSASYINLPSGEYNLQIRSTNSDGVWRDNIRTLKVKVLPTFWETPYAWAIYFLLFILFTGTIVYVLFYIYRLRHKVDMEQQMSYLKLKFFTNVSHELRTPLTLIAGPVSEILENEPLSPAAHRHLNIVHKNTSRMLRLINQILDFRKMDNKKMKVLLEETDIIALIRKTMENFHLIAEEKQINFQLQITEESLYAWVDRDKFEKIIFNLLSNSFKYTPSKKAITIVVTSDSKQMTISVIDEGCGIDLKRQQSLFQRFETFSASGDFSSGIGLSLVKELLDLHHGHIEVKSHPGSGSRFDVTLPIRREAFEGDPQVEFPLSQNEGSEIPVAVLSEQMLMLKPEFPTKEEKEIAGDGERLSILIVEDNNELRLFLKDILSKNYTIYQAANGKEGLENARKYIPDMIVADVMMPVMDGLEMVKELKADRNVCHIPIILLTAKSSLEDRISGVEQGIDDYVTKPFSATYLRTRISSLLRQRKLLQEIYRSALSPGQHKEQSVEPVSLSPSQPQITPFDEQFLRQVMEFMEAQMDNPELAIDDFAAALGLGRTVFYKKLKSIVGLSPIDFIRDIRIKRAVQLIDSGEYNFSQVAYMTGFNDPKYFSRCFKRQMGVTPSEYKEKDT